MIELSKDEFKKLVSYKKPSLKIHDDLLYKRVGYTRASFLKYIISLPNINGFLNPKDLICNSNGEIYGYSMPFFKNAKSMDELLGKIPEEDILNLIEKLFVILEELHKYFIYGDIRNANILFYNNEPYFIDWELGKKIGDSKIIISYYGIYYSKDFNNPLKTDKVRADYSSLTDNIKLFISSLSIIYGIDLEMIAKNKNITILYYILKKENIDSILLDYFRYLIDLLVDGKADVDESIVDSLSLVRLPSKKEKKKLAELIS